MLLLWTWFACPSLIEVQSEWAVYLEQLPECKVDEDCVVIEPGCPLSCYDAVPSNLEAAAQARAEGLAERYRNALRPCTYVCGPRPEAVCQDGECIVGGSITPLPE